jgi:acid phosphatase family membrane protein YuiD
MQFLQDYFIFLIPILVGVITQIIKFALYTVKHGWSTEYIFTHGHMPSSHTALVVSLLTSVGYYEGIHSGVFALAAVLAFIVIDDAIRIRMHLGDQGRYLNMLIEQLPINKEQFPRLKEHVGHRANEVIVGAGIGFFLTLFFIRLFA